MIHETPVSIIEGFLSRILLSTLISNRTHTRITIERRLSELGPSVIRITDLFGL